MTTMTGMPPTKEQLNDMRGDYLVGEFWNEGENKETSVSRYRLWESFSFVGGDLHTKTLTIGTGSLDECLNQCDKKPECHYITFVEGSECWLKTQPYQLIRKEHDDSKAVAALKLGRVGKVGIDDSTPTRSNRRAKVSRRRKFFTQLRQFRQLHETLVHQHMRSVGMMLVLLVGIGGGVAGIGIYVNKNRASFYVNELS